MVKASMENELFNRVFKNKVIFNIIFQWINYIHLREMGIRGYKYNKCGLDFICKNNHFELLKYKLKRGEIEFKESSIGDFCRGNKDVNFFKQIFEKYPHYFKPTSGHRDLLEVSCLSGSLEIVKSINEFSNNYSKEACLKNACKSNSLDLVRYIISNNNDNSFDLLNNIPMDETVQNIEIMKLLYNEVQIKCPSIKMYSSTIATKAAVIGNLDTLKFVFDYLKVSPTPRSINDVASNGHFEVLRFFESKFHYEYTNQAVLGSVKSCNINVINHLVNEKHLIVDDSSLIASIGIEKHSLEIFKLLLTYCNNRNILLKSPNDLVQEILRKSKSDHLEFFFELYPKPVGSMNIEYIIYRNDIRSLKLIHKHYESIHIRYPTILTSSRSDVLEHLVIYERKLFISCIARDIDKLSIIQRIIALKSLILYQNIVSIPEMTIYLLNSTFNVLQFSSLMGFTELVKIIFNSDISANFNKTVPKETLITQQLSANNRELLEFFLESQKFNSMPYDNPSFNPLIYALTLNKMRVIKMISMKSNSTTLTDKEKSQIINCEKPNYSSLKILLDYNIIQLNELVNTSTKNQTKFQKFKDTYKSPTNII